MEPKALYRLNIDPEFELLIPPHTPRFLRKLEASLLADGCRMPLTTWQGFILDGHARYKLCRKHNIPFSIQEQAFVGKDLAFAWVCQQQLKHRKLTPDMRKYLIGKQYEYEKAARRTSSSTWLRQPVSFEDCIALGDRLAEEHGLCRSTIIRYGSYAKSIDKICEKVSAVATDYLSGDYYLPISEINTLSRKTPEEISLELKQRRKTPTKKLSQPQRNRDFNISSERQEAPIPAIKSMPAFDPDAEITGLTLTIPSWISSIDRIINKTDLTIITPQAKARSEATLQHLLEKIDELRVAIKEA